MNVETLRHIMFVYVASDENMTNKMTRNHFFAPLSGLDACYNSIKSRLILHQSLTGNSRSPCPNLLGILEGLSMAPIGKDNEGIAINLGSIAINLGLVF